MSGRKAMMNLAGCTIQEAVPAQRNGQGQREEQASPFVWWLLGFSSGFFVAALVVAFGGGWLP